MINLEGLDLLAEIGGVSTDVDHIANAQRAGLEPDGRDWRVAVIVSHDADTLFWRSGARAGALSPLQPPGTLTGNEPYGRIVAE
jgi:hypothetical protein